jgi:homoserine kinase
MQWGNVGGLIAGLYTQDYDLIGVPFMMKSEPLRSVLPGFDLNQKNGYGKRCFGSEYRVQASILL